MLPQVVAAENNSQENSQESVEMGVGQSLNIVIDSTFSDVEQKISEISRNRKLGQASNPQERARVIAEDLNKTEQDAHNVREQYKSTVEDYKSGNISQREFIAEISKMSNNANRVDSNLKNIEYATQFMNESDLSQEGVTNKKIDEIRNEVGVIGSEVANNIRRKSVGGTKVSVNANQKAIEATISEDNGSIYEGRNEEQESYTNFNITADEALDIFENKFAVNTTDYEIKIKEDDDYTGYYSIEAENSTFEYEILMDGNNGDVVEFEKETSNNKNKDRSKKSENNKNERGDVASGTQGPPPWAQNDKEDDEDDVDEEEKEEKDSDNEYEYNITENDAKSIALDSLSDNSWNLIESEKDDGVYEFEFSSETNTSIKTAEVTVNAASGIIVESEVENESRENDNEEEDEEEEDEGNDTVQIPVESN